MKQRMPWERRNASATADPNKPKAGAMFYTYDRAKPFFSDREYKTLKEAVADYPAAMLDRPLANGQAYPPTKIEKWRVKLNGQWELLQCYDGNGEHCEPTDISAVIDTGRVLAPWSRPWKSKALGCRPYEVDIMNEGAKKMGTGAFYRPDGTCECESRGARAREMKRRGVFDRDAGYGDHAGKYNPTLGKGGGA